MKLSDAIRKGAEETTQTIGDLFDYDAEVDKVISTCALGAAVVGMGKFNEFFGCSTSGVGKKLHPILAMNSGEFPKEFKSHPDIKDLLYGHPGGESSIYYIVWNLNDTYKWSRKAIAEWIETLEDYLESQSEDVIIRSVENTIGQETPAY